MKITIKENRICVDYQGEHLNEETTAYLDNVISCWSSGKCQEGVCLCPTKQANEDVIAKTKGVGSYRICVKLWMQRS